MSRLIIAAVVLAVVFTVYAVIDCAMTESRRTRALSKPVWLLVVLVVPLVGPILWILFGKGLLLAPLETRQSAPDDDKAFLDALGADTVHDERIRQLEDELRALDEQIAEGDRSMRPDADRPQSADETESTGSGPTDDDSAPAPSGEGHDDDDDRLGNGPTRA